VFLLAFVAIALLTVPCTGGRLSRLAQLRLRGTFALAIALFAQIAVISIVPTSPGVDALVHVLSYGTALAFVTANLRVSGMPVVAVGGLLNFVAISANRGVMPASVTALRAAGQRIDPHEFVNSAPVRHARLSFLGDVFSIPASWPLHNVFSVGDVVLGVGIALVIHCACRPVGDEPARKDDLLGGTDQSPGPATDGRPSFTLAGSDHTREPEVMARWLAILFIAGATLSLVALMLPHWSQQNTTATAVSALAAYPAAAVLLRVGRRLPQYAFHLLLCEGTLIITLGVYFGNRGVGSLTAAVFYIWVALYACCFFSRKAAAMHLTIVAVGYGAVLWLQHAPGGGGQWLLVTGTVIVTGIVVGMLVDEIRSVARRDGLTGLWNRRALEEDLERCLATARREGGKVTLAIIDLDDFKACNTRLGHTGADALLVEVATAWRRELRPYDCLARYGGDEFALVCPKSSTDDVIALLERLRRAAPSLTFSAGVATWSNGESAESLERRADGLLFEAKRSGGNRTAVPPDARAAIRSPVSTV
jgi:diguanylate cyclase (GGDEF)-like protein